MRRWAVLMALLALVGGVAAACSSSGGGNDASDDESAPAPTDSSPTTAATVTAPPGETALPPGDRAVARSVREGASEVSVPLSAPMGRLSAAGLLIVVEPRARAAAQQLRATEPSSPTGRRARALGVAGFTDLERCSRRVRIAYTSARPDDPPPSVLSAAVRSCGPGIDKLGDAYERLTGEQLRVLLVDQPG